MPRSFPGTLAAALLLGCQHEESPAARDVDQYIAALSSEDAAAGFALCGGLSTASLRGDCQSDLAERMLTQDSTMAEITAICDTIEEATWRSECWFMAADIRQVTGPMVWGACEQTGRYRDFCFDHALQRELAVVPLPLGEEEAGMAALAALIRLYFPGETDREQQERFNRALAHRIGMRWAGGDFDPALCTPLPGPMCRFAYLHTISTDDAVRAAVCALPQRTAEAVRAAGSIGWSPAGEGIATAVWSDLCAPNNRRGPPHLPRRFFLPLPPE